jgi:hypothetical protein
VAEPFSWLVSMAALIVGVGVFGVPVITGEVEGCEKVVDEDAGIEGFCPSGFLIMSEGAMTVFVPPWASGGIEGLKNHPK